MISRRAITGNRVYRESSNLDVAQNEIWLLLGNDDEKAEMSFGGWEHTRRTRFPVRPSVSGGANGTRATVV